MTFKTPSQISAFIKQAAHDAGFELAGIASVRRHPELEHFEPWVAAGYAGEMKYMKARDETGNLKRASLDSAVPWARSVIVCAINYNTAQPYSTAFNHPGPRLDLALRVEYGGLSRSSHASAARGRVSFAAGK